MSAALLVLLVSRSGKDKDMEAYFLRLSQEMQDRQSASLDSFRSSIEQRMQALADRNIARYGLLGNEQGDDIPVPEQAEERHHVI